MKCGHKKRNVNINWANVVDITDSSGAITEPVTLQEAKDYMRLTGFVDVGESPTTDLSDFSFDNDLIEDLITAAREQFEQGCGISLIPKTLEAVITNECGMIEIPFGPVSSITSLKDSDDEDITDYTIIGRLGGFVNLKSPKFSDMTMVYEAGYGNTDCPAVPKSIKTDMLRLIAYMYENRGDDAGIQRFFQQFAGKYNRNTWL
jgi:hypothetical protein